jgi:hypothetical protein
MGRDYISLTVVNRGKPFRLTCGNHTVDGVSNFLKALTERNHYAK